MYIYIYAHCLQRSTSPEAWWVFFCRLHWGWFHKLQGIIQWWEWLATCMDWFIHSPDILSIVTFLGARWSPLSDQTCYLSILSIKMIMYPGCNLWYPNWFFSSGFLGAIHQILSFHPFRPVAQGGRFNLAPGHLTSRGDSILWRATSHRHLHFHGEGAGVVPPVVACAATMDATQVFGGGWLGTSDWWFRGGRWCLFFSNILRHDKGRFFRRKRSALKWRPVSICQLGKLYCQLDTSERKNEEKLGGDSPSLFFSFW